MSTMNPSIHFTTRLNFSTLHLNHHHYSSQQESWRQRNGNRKRRRESHWLWVTALFLHVLIVTVVGTSGFKLESSRPGLSGCIRLTNQVGNGIGNGGGGSGKSLHRQMMNESLNILRGGGPSTFISPSPSSSSSTPSESPWISYECHVRTLNVDFSNNNFDDMTRITSIGVKCNDKLLFESFLQKNQTLFRLLNLRSMSIKNCKIRRLPSQLWNNLSFLKTLSIQSKNGDWSSSVSLEIEENAFSGLSKIEGMDLSDNNIFSLPDNIFCPLKSLIKLNISRNRLSELEELNSVEQHFVSTSSTLESKPNVEHGGNYYYCAMSVQNVDLSFNSLRHVGHITRWKQLTELRLDNNLIESFEDSAFSLLRQLKFINLSSNRLVALPPTIFKFNNNIREIYLANNSISALAPAVFSELDQLVLLDLSRNTLTSQWIRDKMFHGLVRLVILRLSFNQLSYVDPNIFKNLISLQALNLDNNRIETISPEAFLSLSNLHALDLSNNRLSFVDSRLFSNLLVLRQLYLDHNKIRQIHEDALKNCSSLQDLGIAGNLLQEVPVALRNLGYLRSLDIGENRITQVTNDSFLGLSQLYGLRMVDNRLGELPRGFCESMKKLRVVNLAQNRLYKISSSAFLSCPELRALRLDTNVLEELPQLTLTSQLPSLLWLNVSVNRLESVDYHSIPPTVEWLDLSHNRLVRVGSNLQQDFEPIPSLHPPPPSPPLSSGRETNLDSPTMLPPLSLHLRVLDLSFNNLTRLDSSMIPPSVETIRVNYNKLKTVTPNTFIYSNSLRRVEMVSNQLEYLPLTTIQLPGHPNPQGRNPISMTMVMGRRPLLSPEFHIGGNPFMCDCSMSWLLHTTNHQSSFSFSSKAGAGAGTVGGTGQYPRIVDLDEIACQSPLPSHGGGEDEIKKKRRLIPLGQVTAGIFVCPYKSHCSQTCHCCEFEFCDCAQTCPSNCTCYHDVTWSRNVVDCSSVHENISVRRLPMNATEMYLDGMDIASLASHTFIGKKSLRVLHLNNSHVQSIQNKTFNGLKSLEILHLANNLLTELQGFEFIDCDNLKELHLEHNMIKFIAPDSFNSLKSLEILHLHGNHLTSFNVWELGASGKGLVNLKTLTLSDNPWLCNCEFIIPFRTWISSPTSPIVTDFNRIKCHIVSSHTTTTVTTTTTSSASGNEAYPVTTTLITTTRESQHPQNHSFVPNPNPDTNPTVQQQEPSTTGTKTTPKVMSSGEENGSEMIITTMCQGSQGVGDINSKDNQIMRKNSLLLLPLDGIHTHPGIPGIDSNGDGELVWTLILSSVAILMLILVGYFGLDIYYRLNERLNLFTCPTLHSGSSSTSCCGCDTPREAETGCICSSAYGFSSCCCPSCSSCCENPNSDDSEKLFDAYFLYSKRDEEYLLQKILPELEHGRGEDNSTLSMSSSRLCLHYRDLVLNPLNPWHSQIVQTASDCSRRIVVLVSRIFLHDVHFRVTIQNLICRDHKKLILILLPSLNQQSWTSFATTFFTDFKPTLSSLSNSSMSTTTTYTTTTCATVSHGLKSCSIIEWNDDNFWPKLKHLLPPPTISTITSLRRQSGALTIPRKQFPLPPPPPPRNNEHHITNCPQHQNQQQHYYVQNQNNNFQQQQLNHHYHVQIQQQQNLNPYSSDNSMNGDGRNSQHLVVVPPVTFLSTQQQQACVPPPVPKHHLPISSSPIVGTGGGREDRNPTRLPIISHLQPKNSTSSPLQPLPISGMTTATTQTISHVGGSTSCSPDSTCIHFPELCGKVNVPPSATPSTIHERTSSNISPVTFPSYLNFHDESSPQNFQFLSSSSPQQQKHKKGKKTGNFSSTSSNSNNYVHDNNVSEDNGSNSSSVEHIYSTLHQNPTEGNETNTNIHSPNHMNDSPGFHLDKNQRETVRQKQRQQGQGTEHHHHRCHDNHTNCLVNSPKNNVTHPPIISNGGSGGKSINLSRNTTNHNNNMNSPNDIGAHCDNDNVESLNSTGRILVHEPTMRQHHHQHKNHHHTPTTSTTCSSSKAPSCNMNSNHSSSNHNNSSCDSVASGNGGISKSKSNLDSGSGGDVVVTV